MRELFVYGSLKKGFNNHSVLGSSKFIGKARTINKMTMLDLGSFPGVLLEPDNTTITGELYSVDDDVFKDIEYLEGYPSFYNRKDILVRMDNLEEIKSALIYYLEDSDAYVYDEEVYSGNWE